MQADLFSDKRGYFMLSNVYFGHLMNLLMM